MPTTLTATYKSYAIFTIPKKYRHLPEDRFEVIWCVLHILTDSGKVVKIDPQSNPSDSDTVDWKRGGEITFDEDDPESEDEEQEVVEEEVEKESSDEE